jgi:hypothetical protein
MQKGCPAGLAWMREPRVPVTGIRSATTSPGSARRSSAAGVVSPPPNSPFSQMIRLLPWPRRSRRYAE